MANGEFTKIQQKLWDVLSDGAEHSQADLLLCMDELEANKDSLASQIVRLRRKIQLRGLDVVCVSRGRRFAYRVVRPITAGE